MGPLASQITSLTIVYSTIYSDADQKKYKKLRATGVCVWNSPHTEWPVTRKMFPFDYVIMVHFESQTSTLLVLKLEYYGKKIS